MVPLDGTEVGEAIFPKLDSIVFKDMRHADVEITLLNIIPIEDYNSLTTDKRAQIPHGKDGFSSLKPSASEYLEKIAETLRTKGFKVTTLLRTGAAAEEIVKVANEIEASFIAMSTRGGSGVIRWAIGSVTDKVIRLEGRIPVLAVKANQRGDESPVLPMGSLQGLIKHN